MEKPREYQIEVFNIAKNENIIAILPTGSGKTLIAAMLINHRLELLNQANETKIIAFIAPTRILANQQCEYLSKRINSSNCQKIKSYTTKTVNRNGLTVDLWKQSDWEQETAESGVYVMTAGVLAGILRKSYLPLSVFDFFIFDECHHARGNSSFVEACEYLARSAGKPRILGLTASPIVSNKDSMHSMIQDLERVLMSRALFANELTDTHNLPSCAIVRYNDNRPSVDKSTLSKYDMIKYFNNRSPSSRGSVSLSEEGALSICHARLRMMGVTDLLQIYRTLRTVSAQPSDFSFLKDLSLPERDSLNNISKAKLVPFRVEDNIGNQLFNFIKGVGFKIKQILATAEESGIIMAMFSLQASLADHEIEDLVYAHAQLVEKVKSKTTENLMIGCTLTTVDVLKLEQIANGIMTLPFSVSDLSDAEANTCLSLLDTLITLYAGLNKASRIDAVNEVQENIKRKRHDDTEAIFAGVIDALQIIYDIMVIINEQMDSDISNRQRDSSAADGSVERIKLSIKLGSRGVIEFLPFERQIAEYFRIDHFKVAVFEACRDILKSLNVDEILRLVFQRWTDHPVQYENPNDESLIICGKPEKVTDKKANQAEVSQAIEYPLRLVTDRIQTLCHVLYDDPQRRYNQVYHLYHKDSHSDQAIDLETPDNSALRIDTDCVSIIFCGVRLNAMAMSEFLKKFPPESFLRNGFIQPRSTVGDAAAPETEAMMPFQYEESSMVTDSDMTTSKKRKFPYISRPQSDSNIPSQCLIGGSSVTVQDRILKKFKAGFSNVLIATDVAEEGVDVRSCNLVINFDIPHTFKSYVQRRGRARATNSHFISLIASSMRGQKDLNSLRRFNQQEIQVKAFKANKSQVNVTSIEDAKNPKQEKAKSKKKGKDDVIANAGLEFYTVRSSGASVSSTMAIELLSHYCTQITSDSYYSSEAIYWIVTITENDDGEILPRTVFRCYILLPPTTPAAVRCIAGPLCDNKNKSKCLAALECIRKLHKYGELNDTLSSNLIEFKVETKRLKIRQEDEEEENDEEDRNKTEELAYSESINLSSDEIFHATSIQNTVNITTKVVPDYLVVKHKKIDEPIISDTPLLDDGSARVDINQESRDTKDHGKLLYFYRIRSRCVTCEEHNAVTLCSTCNQYLRGSNEICIAYQQELPSEVIQQDMMFSIREREELSSTMELISYRYVSESDLINLQRFHRAILCWESELLEKHLINDNMFITNQYYCQQTSNMSHKLISDQEWSQSSLGAFYLICPMPFRYDMLTGIPSRRYDLNEIDYDAWHDGSLWSRFLLKCANEAQVLIHNMRVQERLNYISMNDVEYSPGMFVPSYNTSIPYNPIANIQIHETQENREMMDNQSVVKPPTKDDLMESLVSRGRSRLSIGLSDDPSKPIRKIESKRFNDESDDEADTVNTDDSVPNYSDSNVDPSNQIVLMHISSLLTLIPLLGRRFGKFKKKIAHEHTDKIIITPNQCVILGKIQWYLYGLCAPSFIWRIQSILLSRECRAKIKDLIEIQEDKSSRASDQKVITNGHDIHIVPSMNSQQITSPLEMDSKHAKDIPIMLFLEAITPRMCDEPINFERIELLGDSILKLITTMELYRLYPNQDENFLTHARKQFISNNHLCNMGKKLQLMKYIRSVGLSNGSKKVYFRPAGMTLDGWNMNRCLWNIHIVTKKSLGYDDNKGNSTVDRPRVQKSISSFISANVINHRLHPSHVIASIKKKTIADTMESIIGAYYLVNGVDGAIAAIKGLGALPQQNAVTVDRTQLSNHNQAMILSSLLQDSDKSRKLVHDKNTLQLSKEKTFQPVKIDMIPSHYPEQLKRIAMGITPLPQSASTGSKDDPRLAKLFRDSSISPSESKDDMNEDDTPVIPPSVYDPYSINRSRKYATSSFQVTSISMTLSASIIDEMEKLIGYRFRNISYLDEALTHCTVSHKANNQRLEFYGDAVLDFAVVSMLYEAQPWASQGQLSIQKSDITNNANLGKLGLKLGLYKYLIVYSMKLVDDFYSIDIYLWKSKYFSRDFTKEEQRLNDEEDDDGDDMKGNTNDDIMGDNEDEDDEEDVYDKILRRKSAAVKALADAFEALIAAVYLDCNHDLDTIRNIVKYLHLIPQLDE